MLLFPAVTLLVENLCWLKRAGRSQYCDADRTYLTLPAFIMKPPTVSEFAAAAISALMCKDTANPFLFPEQEAEDHTCFPAASFLLFRNKSSALVSYRLCHPRQGGPSGQPARLRKP